ncbi:hypothetical protein EV360DRAFT_90410 [Lentinula raphanica]|nr:hypothetical protein EV360DRAFT_90410 [Lentinula raphanica]
MKFITALVYAASLLFISASAQTSCHTKDVRSRYSAFSKGMYMNTDLGFRIVQEAICVAGDQADLRRVNRDAGSNALLYVSHLPTLAALAEIVND